MLVVTRRSGDTIEIPSLGITIHLVAIRQDRAVVGIDAPKEYVIYRGELLKEREEATECQ